MMADASFYQNILTGDSASGGGAIHNTYNNSVSLDFSGSHSWGWVASTGNSSVVVGDSVGFTGSVGGGKRGRITNACHNSTTVLAPGDTVRVWCSLRTNFAISHGDSGGPLWMWYGAAAGVLHGDLGNNSIFSSWVYTKQWLSVTDPTG